MKSSEWIEKITRGELDSSFSQLYSRNIKTNKERVLSLLNKEIQYFGGSQVGIYASPGRTELGGNHTDHNHGAVLAASIDLDTLGVFSPREDKKVIIRSEGYHQVIEVDLEDLAPRKEEEETSEALIRGIAGYFVKKGRPISGFQGCVSSNVLRGSGLSSSASFEILIGAVQNDLACSEDEGPVFLAMAGQYAENVYFGKPCGLMDQLACAHGGIISIDFKDPSNPHIKPVDYQFAPKGYTLAVLDTGGSHADLTRDYSMIPMEMKKVASYFGEETLGSLSIEDIYKALPDLRRKVGDRPVLRALHFMRDTAKAKAMVDYLLQDDLDSYLKLVAASGLSSFTCLQNIIPQGAEEEQPVAFALGYCQSRWGDQVPLRVHGGGFAGTIQLYIPDPLLEEVHQELQRVFGPRALTEIHIRPKGYSRLA